MVSLANFENFGKMVSSVQDGKIVWCLLSTVAKLSGVFCPGCGCGVFGSPWQKILGVFWVWCLLSGSRFISANSCSHQLALKNGHYTCNSFIFYLAFSILIIVRGQVFLRAAGL